MCNLWLIVDYMSFAGLYFMCIWLCVCTMQPWSNIKVSQPTQGLAIAILIKHLCVCACVHIWHARALCWHLPSKPQASIHLWHKDLFSEADHHPEDSHGKTAVIEFIHSITQGYQVYLHTLDNSNTTGCTPLTKHNSGFMETPHVLSWAATYQLPIIQSM